MTPDQASPAPKVAFVASRRDRLKIHAPKLIQLHGASPASAPDDLEITRRTEYSGWWPEERRGGLVRVESPPGEGKAFLLTLEPGGPK